MKLKIKTHMFRCILKVLIALLIGGSLITGCSTKQNTALPQDRVNSLQQELLTQANEVITYTLPDTLNEQGRGSQNNAVVSFFWNVELRYADDAQLQEICRALKDLSTLSLKDLQSVRYADFDGNPNQWDIWQVLEIYFVSEHQVSAEDFFQDLDQPQSRQIISQTLHDIEVYSIDEYPQEFEPLAPVVGW